MELEVMKKLIRRYQRTHRKIVRDSQRAERYYRKKNDILKIGARHAGSEIQCIRLITGYRAIFTISL